MNVAKGTLQMWLMLRTLRWGDHSELSRWAHCEHMSPYEQRTLPGMVRGRHDWSARRVREMQRDRLWRWRKRTRSRGMWPASAKWKRQETDFSPKASTRKATTITSVLAQWDLHWSSVLWCYKIVNWCCLSCWLWKFVNRQQRKTNMTQILGTWPV